MEPRFQQRLEELLDDAQVPMTLLDGLVERLDDFLRPFTQRLQRVEQVDNAHRYVAGLLSNLKRKNAEAIAYLHDSERQALQKFLGLAPWDTEPLVHELTQQVADQLGETDGVLVFDPSAFPKCGTKSVGVQRQWCGRLGKVDNCQVGVYLGYVSRHEHALVDVRLYLPRSWATDKKRRREAGVPRSIRFRTRHQLALEMLDQRGPVLPHAWIAGDDEMGRSTWFRRQLRLRQEQYLLAVPSNTLIRDLEAEPPPSSGRGRRRCVPFVRVELWRAALPETAWTTVEVRPGAKGPLVVQVVKTRVRAKTDQRRVGPEELLVIVRRQTEEGSFEHDSFLSNAEADTDVGELARVVKAEYRIEECFRRAKSEAGLADYQVRNWRGWHHHQCLALLAGWFLVQESRRGKKTSTGFDRSPTDRAAGGRAAPPVASRPSRAPLSSREPCLAAQ